MFITILLRQEKTSKTITLKTRSKTDKSQRLRIGKAYLCTKNVLGVIVFEQILVNVPKVREHNHSHTALPPRETSNKDFYILEKNHHASIWPKHILKVRQPSKYLILGGGWGAGGRMWPIWMKSRRRMQRLINDCKKPGENRTTVHTCGQTARRRSNHRKRNRQWLTAVSQESDSLCNQPPEGAHRSLDKAGVLRLT